MSKSLASRVRGRVKRLLHPEPRGRPVPAETDWALAVPFADTAIAPGTFRIAVMIHLFHPELTGEFRALLEALPPPCDVLITTDSAAKSDAIAQGFARWDKGAVTIRLVPNRGRDIAPKLTAFREDYSRYDLVLFLHSKKSATVDWGETWRQQILSSLCGSAQVVGSILTLFARDARLGLVAPKSLDRVHRMMRWGDTADAKALAARLGVELDCDGALDFPAGSMFWARPDALRPLLELHLAAEDFPEEAGQTTATLAHAVERLFYIVCEKAGYSWLKVADPRFFEDQGTLLEVSGEADLAQAIVQGERSVSATMLR